MDNGSEENKFEPISARENFKDVMLKFEEVLFNKINESIKNIKINIKNEKTIPNITANLHKIFC